MIGHCLAASGSIECVASVLQLKNDFLFPNVNLDAIHPEILSVVDASKIPVEKTKIPLQTIIKASFGFGDVNCCLIFDKYQ
jgi:3-oxoacyl-(acyl-carrier-protein) synthase